MLGRHAAVALLATLLLSVSVRAEAPASSAEASSRRHFQNCVVALYESDLALPVPKDPKAEVYRLLFLPRFSDQTSMRVILWGDGTGRMTYHRLNYSSCEKNTNDVEEEVYAVSRDDVVRIKAAIGDYDFWNSPYRPEQEPITCSDGVAAFFEGLTEAKHNLINRRCAWSRKFQNIVDLFHRLAQTKQSDNALILD